jgi:hypothetical protein
MLRLASSYEDTQNRPLLASIAGIVFIGCPLRDSPSGTMVEAMKNMAAAVIGVGMHDRVLHELVGGDQDACLQLVYEGRDALEQARHEYGFPVKTYRETIIIPPADDTYFPWVALALRRDSESLEGAAQEDEAEYIESDHLNMCRFASAGNDGYRSLASFILKIAHHHLLRVSDRCLPTYLLTNLPAYLFPSLLARSGGEAGLCWAGLSANFKTPFLSSRHIR